MVKTHGSPPYQTVLLHGGPGATGEMAPVGDELSHLVSTLEPYQSAMCVQGQVDELHKQLGDYAETPYILIGFSWGAFLALLYADQYPDRVSKLILISCPSPFPVGREAIRYERLKRLTIEESERFEKLMAELSGGSPETKAQIFSQLIPLFKKTESFDPIESDTLETEFDFNLFEKVWVEAAGMRKEGVFKDILSRMEMPMTFIHGMVDPHPIQDIRMIVDERPSLFKLIPLDKCGHKPWEEKQARLPFYDFLKKELFV